MREQWTHRRKRVRRGKGGRGGGGGWSEVEGREGKSLHGEVGGSRDEEEP